MSYLVQFPGPHFSFESLVDESRTINYLHWRNSCGSPDSSICSRPGGGKTLAPRSVHLLDEAEAGAVCRRQKSTGNGAAEWCQGGVNTWLRVFSNPFLKGGAQKKKGTDYSEPVLRDHCFKLVASQHIIRMTFVTVTQWFPHSFDCRYKLG